MHIKKSRVESFVGRTKSNLYNLYYTKDARTVAFVEIAIVLFAVSLMFGPALLGILGYWIITAILAWLGMTHAIIHIIVALGIIILAAKLAWTMFILGFTIILLLFLP